MNLKENVAFSTATEYKPSSGVFADETEVDKKRSRSSSTDEEVSEPSKKRPNLGQDTVGDKSVRFGKK